MGCLVGGGVWWVGSGFGWWGGVACGGLFPLDPSLTPPPAAWCAVVLGSGRPSVGWWLLFCWWLSVGCSSFLGWVACLAGCVLVGLFSTWGVGCCSCWLFRFGRVVVGGVLWLRALWVVFLSGGCSFAGCVVPVGRADLDGRALRRPLFLPHDTRRDLPDPRIRWGNSHVKTLTD